MTQIESILAEIQRLKKELRDYSATEALDYIESYVNLVALEKPQEPTIKGWVARDFDGQLILGEYKPRRLYGNIWGDFGEYMNIDQNLFPDLKYSDEPIEVELIIKQL